MGGQRASSRRLQEEGSGEQGPEMGGWLEWRGVEQEALRATVSPQEAPGVCEK